MTKLLYLEDFTRLEVNATAQDVLEDGGKTFVVLDQTIFYPQGGGQPYDTGVIESGGAKFLVSEVRFVDGIVRHIGSFESGTFKKEDIVMCHVDSVRRELNSRIHSAGHVVDLAVSNIMPDWISGKGYHFPDGPYVEYVGNLDGVDQEKLKTDIEAACNKYVQESRAVTVKFVQKGELAKLCRFVPDNIPTGKPIRIVMFGDFAVPCGGTHVGNLSDIQSMTIRKIKSNGENIRVAYDVAR